MRPYRPTLQGSLATADGGDPAESSKERLRTTGGFPRMAHWASIAAIFLIILALGTYAGLRVAIARMEPSSLEAAQRLLAPPQSDRTQSMIAARHPGYLPVEPEDVDPRYLAMLLAFEDRRFYSHFGVDPYALTRAALELVWHGRIVSGGSTLTMQVARILDNEYKRSTAVKLRQIARALQLEARFTKREILKLYLNLAPFGGGIKGIRAASLAYFGRTPERLSLGEAALLVALPQAPEARRLDRHAGAARRSRNFVLITVAAAGVVSVAEAERGALETVGGLEPSVEAPPTLLTLEK